MSFVSPEFALLCLVFLPIYWSLAEHPRAQRSLLIVSAYGLYATWVPVFAWVLLAYSTVIWALGRWMQRAGAGRLPWVLGLWLAGSFLVFIKYYEFVRETFQALLQLTGFVSLLPVVDWVAPVGVSFFTFQAVSYLVMVGRAPALARSWPDVLLFLSFWPTLFAGPIWRAEHFFAQTDETDAARRVGRPRRAWLALYLITLGLVQKVVLASWLSAQVVDPVYKYPDQYASVSLAAAMLGYSLQILLDFAVGPWIAQRNSGQGHPAWRLPGLMGVAIYGGYFNGGLGILLMALYTLTGENRLNTVNALKNLNSFVLSLLSVAAFAVAGAIVWPQALWMMALATAGGWAGARLAKRLPVRWVRWLVIGTGLVMSVVFFTRTG